MSSRTTSRWSVRHYADTPIAIAIACAWLLLLSCVSLLPKYLKAKLGDKPAFHQAEHILVFAFTTYLLLSLSNRGSRRVSIVFVVSAVAVTSEVLQYLFTPPPYAIFEWWDVRDDFIGILGSMALFSWLATLRRN